MKQMPSLKSISRIFSGCLFIFASTFHFIAADTELRIIPPFLPLRRTALYITGVLEFIGGVGMLLPRFQQQAGQGLAALLVAIFPANMYHTFIRKQFRGLTRSLLYHIMRWPLQGVLIWLVLWSTQKDK